MPSSAAAVEGLEEGDALDVSSLSLSLAFLREDMFLRSRPEWFRSSKSVGTLQEARTLSHLRHTQNKKCLSDQSHSRFEVRTKEEGEEEKDKDAVPQVQVRKKKG